jgi:tRNA nucleotidyltransferase (CCA-adding enzyme)
MQKIVKYRKGVIMLDIEEIKSKIIKRLKPLNPNKIILFGSYAYGTPHKDSDIDLYVVTNDDFIRELYFNDTKPDGTMIKLTDPTKLYALGWTHGVEPDEGIQEMYNWYLKEKSLR